MKKLKISITGMIFTMAWCCLLPSVSAGAQAVPSPMSFLTNSYVGANGALMSSMLSNWNSSTDDEAPGTLASLTFTSSPEITRAINTLFIDSLSKNYPEQSAQVKKIFQSGSLLTLFDNLLQKFNFSPNNLGDVFTAFIILSWEVVNNGDATQYPKGIVATRERVTAALARNKRIKALDNESKQKMAEAFADLAMLNTLARKELIREKDTARLWRLEKTVQKTVDGMGLDLSKLQLTNQGFVKK